MDAIRVLERCQAYSDPTNPWVAVYYDRVELAGGREARLNRVIESEGHGGVAILPVKDGHVGLVRQFRYPANRDMWEIPRGFGESEDAREEARRELEEEMGVLVPPQFFTALGPVHPNSGLLTTVVEMFLADCTACEIASNPGTREITESAWLPLDEVLDMAGRGEITDSFTLAAILKAQLLGLLGVESTVAEQTNGST